MQFDSEGHVCISPREWQALLADPLRLVRDFWLVGTPWAFQTHDAYQKFRAFLADRLSVHPNNFVVRGSTKIGFSVSPDADKLWVKMRPDSDLDLAIIDTDYFHFFDREIRGHERRLGSAAFHGFEARKKARRDKYRRFYTYRYGDLPDIGCVEDHNHHLSEAPLQECCGQRPLSAFIYRDWWAVQSRCEYDLFELVREIRNQRLPDGGHEPRPYERPKGAREAARGHDKALVAKSSCPICGGILRAVTPGGLSSCPTCEPITDDPEEEFGFGIDLGSSPPRSLEG